VGGAEFRAIQERLTTVKKALARADPARVFLSGDQPQTARASPAIETVN
jgi:hypothetical protein